MMDEIWKTLCILRSPWIEVGYEQQQKACKLMETVCWDAYPCVTSPVTLQRLDTKSQRKHKLSSTSSIAGLTITNYARAGHLDISSLSKIE